MVGGERGVERGDDVGSADGVWCAPSASLRNGRCGDRGVPSTTALGCDAITVASTTAWTVGASWVDAGRVGNTRSGDVTDEEAAVGLSRDRILVLAVGTFLIAVVLGVGADQADQARPVADEQVVDLEGVDDLGALDGRRVAADGVRVDSVPADEGFWISVGGRRVWVLVTTAWESPFVVEPGDRATFTGQVVSHGPDFADRPEFSSADAEDLVEAGAHIEVDVDDLRLDGAG